jgi:hypothetical protein
MSSHQRSTVSRILAVEDEQCSAGLGTLEELSSEKVFVVVVDSTLDVATFVLILESAINDHLLIV